MSAQNIPGNNKTPPGVVHVRNSSKSQSRYSSGVPNPANARYPYQQQYYYQNQQNHQNYNNQASRSPVPASQQHIRHKSHHQASAVLQQLQNPLLRNKNAQKAKKNKWNYVKAPEWVEAAARNRRSSQASVGGPGDQNSRVELNKQLSGANLQQKREGANLKDFGHKYGNQGTMGVNSSLGSVVVRPGVLESGTLAPQGLQKAGKSSRGSSTRKVQRKTLSRLFEGISPKISNYRGSRHNNGVFGTKNLKNPKNSHNQKNAQNGNNSGLNGSSGPNMDSNNSKTPGYDTQTSGNIIPTSPLLNAEYSSYASKKDLRQDPGTNHASNPTNHTHVTHHNEYNNNQSLNTHNRTLTNASVNSGLNSQNLRSSNYDFDRRVSIGLLNSNNNVNGTQNDNYRQSFRRAGQGSKEPDREQSSPHTHQRQAPDSPDKSSGARGATPGVRRTSTAANHRRASYQSKMSNGNNANAQDHPRHHNRAYERLEKLSNNNSVFQGRVIDIRTNYGEQFVKETKVGSPIQIEERIGEPKVISTINHKSRFIKEEIVGESLKTITVQPKAADKALLVESMQRIVLLALENQRLVSRNQELEFAQKMVLKQKSEFGERLNQFESMKTEVMRLGQEREEYKRRIEVYLEERTEMVRELESYKISHSNNTQEIESKIMMLAQENERLILTREDVQKEYKKLLGDYNEKSKIEAGKDKAIKTLKKEKRELENRVQLLNTKNKSLVLSAEKNKELLLGLKTRLRGAEEAGDLAQARLKAELTGLREQLELVSNEHSKEKNYKIKMISRIKEFEEVVLKLQEENAKISDRASFRANEVTRIKSESQKTSNQLSGQIGDLEAKIKLLATENERLTSMLDSARLELRQSHGFQVRLQEAEDKLRLLASENERLQTIIKDRSGKKDTLEEAKRRLEADLERLMFESKKTSKSLKSKEKELADQSRHYEGLLGKLSKDHEVKIQNLNADNDKMLARCKDVVEEIEAIKSHNDVLQDEARDLKDQVSQLVHQLKLKEISLDDKSKRIEELESDKSGRIEQVELLEDTVFRLRQEFEGVTGKLRGVEADLLRKNQILGKLKKKDEESLARIEELAGADFEHSRQNKQLGDRVEALLAKIGEIENSKISVENELKKERGTVGELQDFLEQLSTENQLLEKSSAEKDLKISKISEELKSTQNSLEAAENEAHRLKITLEASQTDLARSNDENDRLRLTTQRLNSTIKELDSTIIGLNNANDSSQDQIGRLNLEVANLQKRVESLESIIANLKADVSEKQENIIKKEAENEKLGRNLKEAKNELEGLREEVSGLEGDLGLQSERLEESGEVLMAREREIEDLRRKLDLMDLEVQDREMVIGRMEEVGAQLEVENEQLGGRVRDLEAKKVDFRVKIQNLEIESKQLRLSLEEACNKIGELEASETANFSKIDDFSQKIGTLENEKNSLQITIEHLEELKIDQTGQIKALETTLGDIGSEKSELMTHIETLKNSLSELEVVIREKIEVITTQKTQIDTQKGQIEEFEVEVENLSDELRRLGEALEGSRGRVGELEGVVGQKDDQIQKILDDSESAFEDLNGKIESLESMNEQLGDNIRQIELENAEKVEKFEIQISEISANLTESRQFGDDLSSENDELKAIIESKSQAIASAEQTNQNLTLLLDELKTTLTASEDEIKASKILIREQELAMRHQEAEMSSKMAKIEKLEKELKSTTSSLEHEKSQVDALGTQIELKTTKIRELEFKLDTLTREKTDLSFELQSSKETTSTLQDLIQRLEATQLTLQTDQKDKNDEIEKLKKRIKEMENQFDQLELEYKRIIEDWTRERQRIHEENQRLEFISRDRLQEVEKKSYENGRLLIRLAMAYAELDRINGFRSFNRELFQGAEVVKSQYLPNRVLGAFGGSFKVSEGVGAGNKRFEGVGVEVQPEEMASSLNLAENREKNLDENLAENDQKWSSEAPETVELGRLEVRGAVAGDQGYDEEIVSFRGDVENDEDWDKFKRMLNENLEVVAGISAMVEARECQETARSSQNGENDQKGDFGGSGDLGDSGDFEGGDEGLVAGGGVDEPGIDVFGEDLGVKGMESGVLVKIDFEVFEPLQDKTRQIGDLANRMDATRDADNAEDSQTDPNLDLKQDLVIVGPEPENKPKIEFEVVEAIPDASEGHLSSQEPPQNDENPQNPSLGGFDPSGHFGHSEGFDQVQLSDSDDDNQSRDSYLLAERQKTPKNHSSASLGELQISPNSDQNEPETDGNDPNDPYHHSGDSLTHSNHQ